MISPQIKRANLEVNRSHFATTEDTETQQPSGPVTGVGYTFSNVDMKTKPKFMIPKSADPALNRIKVGAGGDVFYTEGTKGR